MAKDKSFRLMTSSDESEEESTKRKHHRHDRFKVERKTGKKVIEDDYKVKIHKHKKRKKHKHKKSVEFTFSHQRSVQFKKSAGHSQIIPFKTTSTIVSGDLRAGGDSKEVERKLNVLSKIEANQDLYGPSLPPGFKVTSDNIFGPVLPPMFVPPNETLELSNKDNIFGPVLPLAKETRPLESEDFVGPIPEGFGDSSENMSLIQRQLTSRADYLKVQLSKETQKTEDDVSKRECWMLELPPEKSAVIGLAARTFRRREGPDMGDRSVWTDTPEMKLKREMEGKTDQEKKYSKLKSEVVKANEVAIEKQLAQSSSKHRTKSLLEIHQEKRKKKLKKEKKEKNTCKPERRPFDRKVDLQVHRFDDAQRKVIYKKAQLLNSRFSSGDSKFL